MNDQSIFAAVITVSDSRTLETDASGDMLSELLGGAGISLAERAIIKDDRAELAALLRQLSVRDDISLIVTTGGTGVGPRDVTPEATRDVIDVEVPGIPEAMRQGTFPRTKTAVLSRAVAGVCRRTLIINLPGSVKGVRECFEIIAPILGHAVAQVQGAVDHEKTNLPT
jgi:molybdopterin adenylyltransferase